MARWISVFLLLFCVTAYAAEPGPIPDADALYQLSDSKTKQVNALWGENPKERQFGDGKTKVVIADIKGPGVITMIHFALPAVMKLNRDTILRIYWDGEKTASVQSPLVDFFADPNGALERVESALVNKKRGWNCYFPMPFARSAKVELQMDNARYPNGSWGANPCYSYVIYRTVDSLPKDSGYFHAEWRQQKLLLGKEPYKVFEADGQGQFIGWNCTVRGVGSPTAGYPVDENVDFFVDGEKEPSISWQGLEDSFGFSWGFPREANGFQYTGYQPYYNGAAAYRFTLNDRISFKKTMRMKLEFGEQEKMFLDLFSKPENPLEFSSVAYWYQREPHTALTAIPSGAQRRPSMLASLYKPQGPGEMVVIDCGTAREDLYLADGWDYSFKKGYSFQGPQWTTEVNYCWADNDEVQFDITCPKGAAGTLKLFIIDGDNFGGGRKESVRVAGRLIGQYDNFQTGKWIDVPISASDTAKGSVPVAVKNLNPGSNAVVSQIRFVTK